MATTGSTLESERATVFVVDDDPSIRRSLSRLLRSHGFQVEVFSGATEFLSREPASSPSCLLLDVQMPGLSGLDLQEELSERQLDPAVVFITGHGTVPMSVRAMKKGAVDFLQKPFAEEDLLAAVRQGLQRDARQTQMRAELSVLEERYATLTHREREVFGLVVAGLLNKQIAGRLGTSEKTIKVHRGRVMRKMRANSLADLVRMGERLSGVMARGYDQGPIAHPRPPS